MGRGRLAVLALLAAALASFPAWGPASALPLIGEAAYYLALAQLWNLLAGYTGVVSIGQQAYVGFGGYCLFIFTIYAGLPPLAALGLAGLCSSAIALPAAWVLFRLRGAYFAIGSWVLAEVFRLSFAQVSALGGGSGQSLPVAVVKGLAESRFAREVVTYSVSIALAIGAVAGVYLFLRARHGLALTAIRDSERAAEAIGINRAGMKLGVYLIAAFGTGIVGALVFLEKLRISPDAAFSVMDWTANVIFIVVIGGIGTIEGPIVGTLVFFALRELLADFGSWYLILWGAVAVVVMLKAPQGIWGLAVQRFDVHLFPVRRKVVVQTGE
jgi:branched-chain amino acid transport system permease protein